MALTDHVQITITPGSIQLSRPGFGVPMILSCKSIANSFPERLRFYTSTTGVLADFASDTPEYLATAAIFAQSPRPPRIAIGRALGQPTQRYEITPVAQDDTLYEITVAGEGMVTETVSYTSDGTALLSEVTAGLTSALNGVASNNYTAVDNGTSVTVTADAAADWFSLESLDHALISITQDHAEPATSLATDLAAISNYNDGWYALYTLYNSTAYVNAAAAYIETVKKFYLAESADSVSVQIAEGSGTDVLDDLDEFDYTRVGGFWHPSPADMAGARLLGRWLPLDPGTETAAYKILAGVASPTLTETQRSNLSDRRATYYKTEADQAFTWQGQTADQTYAFMDTRRFVDKLESDIVLAVFGAFLSGDKIPFTDPGISQIKGQVLGAILAHVGEGVAEDPAPVVTAPTAADVSDADKALRHLPDVEFSATYSGAIHSVAISGVLSL